MCNPTPTDTKMDQTGQQNLGRETGSMLFSNKQNIFIDDEFGDTYGRIGRMLFLQPNKAKNLLIQMDQDRSFLAHKTTLLREIYMEDYFTDVYNINNLHMSNAIVASQYLRIKDQLSSHGEQTEDDDLAMRRGKHNVATQNWNKMGPEFIQTVEDQLKAYRLPLRVHMLELMINAITRDVTGGTYAWRQIVRWDERRKAYDICSRQINQFSQLNGHHGEVTGEDDMYSKKFLTSLDAYKVLQTGTVPIHHHLSEPDHLKEVLGSKSSKARQSYRDERAKQKPLEGSQGLAMAYLYPNIRSKLQVMTLEKTDRLWYNAWIRGVVGDELLLVSIKPEETEWNSEIQYNDTWGLEEAETKHVYITKQMPNIDGLETIVTLDQNGHQITNILRSGLDKEELESANDMGISIDDKIVGAGSPLVPEVINAGPCNIKQFDIIHKEENNVAGLNYTSTTMANKDSLKLFDFLRGTKLLEGVNSGKPILHKDGLKMFNHRGRSTSVKDSQLGNSHGEDTETDGVTIPVTRPDWSNNYTDVESVAHTVDYWYIKGKSGVIGLECSGGIATPGNNYLKISGYFATPSFILVCADTFPTINQGATSNFSLSHDCQYVSALAGLVDSVNLFDPQPIIEGGDNPLFVLVDLDYTSYCAVVVDYVTNVVKTTVTQPKETELASSHGEITEGDDFDLPIKEDMKYENSIFIDPNYAAQAALTLSAVDPTKTSDIYKLGVTEQPGAIANIAAGLFPNDKFIGPSRTNNTQYPTVSDFTAKTNSKNDTAARRHDLQYAKDYINTGKADQIFLKESSGLPNVAINIKGISSFKPSNLETYNPFPAYKDMRDNVTVSMLNVEKPSEIHRMIVIKPNYVIPKAGFIFNPSDALGSSGTRNKKSSHGEMTEEDDMTLYTISDITAWRQKLLENIHAYDITVVANDLTYLLKNYAFWNTNGTADPVRFRAVTFDNELSNMLIETASMWDATPVQHAMYPNPDVGLISYTDYRELLPVSLNDKGMKFLEALDAKHASSVNDIFRASVGQFAYCSVDQIQALLRSCYSPATSHYYAPVLKYFLYILASNNQLWCRTYERNDLMPDIAVANINSNNIAKTIQTDPNIFPFTRNGTPLATIINVGHITIQDYALTLTGQARPNVDLHMESSNTVLIPMTQTMWANLNGAVQTYWLCFFEYPCFTFSGTFSANSGIAGGYSFDESPLASSVPIDLGRNTRVIFMTVDSPNRGWVPPAPPVGAVLPNLMVANFSGRPFSNFVTASPVGLFTNSFTSGVMNLFNSMGLWDGYVNAMVQYQLVSCCWLRRPCPVVTSLGGVTDPLGGMSYWIVNQMQPNANDLTYQSTATLLSPDGMFSIDRSLNNTSNVFNGPGTRRPIHGMSPNSVILRCGLDILAPFGEAMAQPRSILPYLYQSYVDANWFLQCCRVIFANDAGNVAQYVTMPNLVKVTNDISSALNMYYLTTIMKIPANNQWMNLQNYALPSYISNIAFGCQVGITVSSQHNLEFYNIKIVNKPVDDDFPNYMELNQDPETRISTTNPEPYSEHKAFDTYYHTNWFDGKALNPIIRTVDLNNNAINNIWFEVARFTSLLRWATLPVQPMNTVGVYDYFIVSRQMDTLDQTRDMLRRRIDGVSFYKSPAFTFYTCADAVRPNDNSGVLTRLNQVAAYQERLQSAARNALPNYENDDTGIKGEKQNDPPSGKSKDGNKEIDDNSEKSMSGQTSAPLVLNKPPGTNL